MNKIEAYIESGIIESYVLGIAMPDEVIEVEKMAAAHPQVREAINTFCESLEFHAQINAVSPPVTIKPFLLATIDYTERLMGGEVPAFPPQLHTGSSIADYNEWINRMDMVLPAGFNEDYYAKIIGYTPEVTTAIIWIKDMAPAEVHDNEFERFLILEGTCDITIGTEVHQLVPGDFLAIPLFMPHLVTVTSSSLCKLILQRVAA